MRVRHKSGCVWLDGNTWWFRAGSKAKAIRLGTVAELKNKSAARKAAQPHVMAANDETSLAPVTLDVVIGRYKKEDLPKLRLCTSRVYLGLLDNHITPQWGRTPIDKIDAYEVQGWLEGRSGKAKKELRGLIGRLVRRSMLWGYQKQGPNPMDLIDLKDLQSKKAKRILTVAEFNLVASHLDQPFRTMACVALFHGLRVSELLGLKWGDVNWFDKSLTIQRSVVCQIEGVPKTPASQAKLPLEKEELEMLLAHRGRTEFIKDSDYIFASPHLGGDKPYHYTSFLWKLSKACKSAGVPQIGTHVFRHTARAWTGELNIPLATIKDMFRHADIRTTMNVYGGTVPETMRKAHGQVVKMASSS